MCAYVSDASSRRRRPLPNNRRPQRALVTCALPPPSSATPNPPSYLFLSHLPVFKMFRRALPASMKHLVVKEASPDAKKLVLDIIRSKQHPLTIQELYKEATSSQEHMAADDAYIIHSMRCGANLTAGLSIAHVRPGTGTLFVQIS